MVTSVLKPANILGTLPTLNCDACGRNILGTLSAGDRNRSNAIVIVLKAYDRASQTPSDSDNILAIAVCCKGSCDDLIKRKLQQAFPLSTDSWFDLDDLLIPIRHLRVWVNLARRMARGDCYEKAALDKYIGILLATAPFVARDMTPGEAEIHNRLSELDAMGL